jgi:hypothetical protein
MANRPATVKQAELTRYIAAAVKAGLAVQRAIVASDGTVTLVFGGSAASSDEAVKQCDRLLDP